MPVTEYNSLNSPNNGAHTYMSSDIVQTGPARIRGALVYNSGPQQFLQFFDANVVPADGTIPRWVFVIGAGQSTAINFPEMRDFDSGVAWSNSSTARTKTVGAADLIVQIAYGIKTNQ